MSTLTYLKSDQPLGGFHPNMGSLISFNQKHYPDQRAFGQRTQGPYQFWTWQQVFEDVLRFSHFLKNQELKTGDRVAFITDRSYHRLIAELAVMANGLTSVPIFKGYSGEMKSQLLGFSEVTLLITDHKSDVTGINTQTLPKRTCALGTIHLSDFSDQFVAQDDWLHINTNQPAIMLFTSGTTAFPKGVMLSHKNILAQQKAHQIFWNLPKGFKVLSYLPWDHAFGSLFERFLTFYSGACLCLDDSMGKDMKRLLENFSTIQPEYFFSVPLVYERIHQFLMQHPGLEERFFHPKLRFLFTAAAPLAPKIAEYFQKRQVPVAEGWGLTETAPSATLTQPSLKKSPGHVGLPIPGVEIKSSSDHEILVRGHNVMLGYFKYPNRTKESIDGDGWLKTGDLGSLSRAGLKIFSRKDQVFKLSNGKKINPREMENCVKSCCRSIHHIYIYGKGERYCRALAFSDPSESNSTFHELKSQIIASLHHFNQAREDKMKRIGCVILIHQNLSVEQGELTPSQKIRPNIIEKNYGEYLKLPDFNRCGLIQDGVWIERLVEDV